MWSFCHSYDMDDNGFLELDSNGELVRLDESLQGPPGLDRTTSAAREVLDLASLASPPLPLGAEKSEKADGQQQEESEEESLFVLCFLELDDNGELISSSGVDLDTIHSSLLPPQGLGVYTCGLSFVLIVNSKGRDVIKLDLDRFIEE